MFGKHLIHLQSTTSTNSYASNLIAKGDPKHGTVISTDYQTQGKGQIGRFWFSSPQKNILTSFIGRPENFNANDQFYINIVASLAIRDTIHQIIPDQNVFLKWPNDIYVKSRKIAGILIETQLTGKLVTNLIVGIGINVNENAFPEELIQATSLLKILGYEIPMETVWEKLIDNFNKYYSLLEAKEGTKLRNLYHQFLYKIDETITLKDNQGFRFVGKILGVDLLGKLKVQYGEIVKLYNFGEIKIVL